jgi:predicted CXXCH cytochrome family protein
LDLSGRTHFNFYLKLTDRTQVSKVVVKLHKTDLAVSVAQMATGSGSGFKNGQWHLVSLPKASFDDPDWGAVNLISFTFYEQTPDQAGTTTVWLDEIGCDVTGPDVVGNNSDSGYYATGHKMLCSRCHDQSSDHIDGNRATFIDYIKDTNNPTAFRFYDDPDMQMELPYSGGYTTQQFALCYQCHEEAWIMEDASAGIYDPDHLNTNFESYNFGQHNLHYYHITQWGATCVTCHDPHGQWNPAMNRVENGDLVYTYDYTYDGETIPNRTEDRNDNDVPDWYDGTVNFYGKMTGTHDRALCTTCHGGAYFYYYRTYKRIPHGGPCGDCHDAHLLDDPSHMTHTQANLKGPDPLDCSHCHGLEFDPNNCENCHDEEGQVISDIDNMTLVSTCDNCHSPGGQDGFDGVQMGADNWELGAYEAGLLRTGSEKWCASCHDDEPASSNADGTGELAPTMTGDNDTYGYYVTGHGLPVGDEYDLMCFQEGSGNGNLGADVICDQCHDSGSDHILPGEHVTRLKAGFENDQANSTCVQCHPPGTDATAPPELYTNSDDYEAAGHGQKLCTECHDVHGTVTVFGVYPAMTGGDCRSLCLSCHNVAGLPEIVSAHDENSEESCSSACHNPHMPAHGGGQGDDWSVCFSAGCHTVNPMHATHFDPVEGAGFPPDEDGCYFCHSGGTDQCGEHASFFKTGADDNGDGKYSLPETDVCDLCHVAGGW